LSFFFFSFLHVRVPVPARVVVSTGLAYV
jgi:hypothetical protein